MNSIWKLLLWVGLSGPIVVSPANAKDPEAVAFAMEIGRIKYEFIDGMHKYHHARTYVVRNDVGVTLTKGKVCYIEKKNCISAVVNYRIEPGKSLTQLRHLVATTLDTETVTVEYWGKDDAGNDVAVKKTFRLTGDAVKVE